MLFRFWNKNSSLNKDYENVVRNTSLNTNNEPLSNIRQGISSLNAQGVELSRLEETYSVQQSKNSSLYTGKYKKYNSHTPNPSDDCVSAKGISSLNIREQEERKSGNISENISSLNIADDVDVKSSNVGQNNSSE